MSYHIHICTVDAKILTPADLPNQAANGLVSNQFWWFGFSFGLTGFSGKWFEQHTGVVWFSSTTKIIWIGVVWFIFGLTLAD